MKTANDPRHLLRRRTVKELFANEFAAQESSPLVKKIIKKSVEIDRLILNAAPEWPIEKINKIDLAILRLSVWELLEKKNPEKVVVDEAVELGKEYGSEASPAFVNGVLGKIIDDIK